MVFSIVVIILLAAIVFVHFVQGMFSATLSAIAAVFAAAIALGLNESVLAMMKPGKFADSATGMMLCILFAASYVILRVLIDKLVPGNVRLQPTIDKVGAVVMGAVAGVFACGIIAIAAQTMPFGPSIFGYSRYPVSDPYEVTFASKQGETQMVRSVTDESKFDTFKPDAVQKLLLPVDDLVLNTVTSLSDGPLSTGRRFGDTYPDYLAESFGQRLGLEPGAKHTATNFGTQQSITVSKVYVRDAMKQVLSAELTEIRRDKNKQAAENGKEEVKEAPKPLTPASKAGAILVVRVDVGDDARDGKDKLFRFSPANIRLIARGKDDRTHDLYPAGTIDTWGGQGGSFWPNKIGDPLFLAGDKQGVDLVFILDDKDLVLAPGSGKAKNGAQQLVVKPDTYLEVKRLARVDLSGTEVDQGPVAPNPAYDPMRKQRLKAPPVPPQG